MTADNWEEATAATTAYDRLSLFEGDIARKLQTALKEYVRARVDLYRMAHDFLPLQRERKIFRTDKKASCFNSRTTCGTRWSPLARRRTTGPRAHCRYRR